MPKYPIFRGIEDPMVHALLAVLVGCDACPGGVKGKGPKAVHELIWKHSNLSGKQLQDELAKDISAMAGAFVNDPTAVLCIAKLLLYEMTHDGYIHDSPVELEEYLEDWMTFISPSCFSLSHPFFFVCLCYSLACFSAVTST
jgi:hypothetical protein